jgi:phosphohistidine swiveling domain-containing protein
MKMNNWQKIFVRKNCDLRTFEGIILTAYDEIWQTRKDRKELLFGHFKDKHFTYYSRGVDRWQVGRRIYKKRFNTKLQFIEAYKSGLKLLKTTTKKTLKWKNTLQKPDSHKLLTALEEFNNDFNLIQYNYSISPWWALEAWQYDFEKIVAGLIKRNGLENRYEQIVANLLRPWKETAIRIVGKKLKQGAPTKQLVKEFQFLRSWTAVWYKPIEADWIRSTAQNPLVERPLSQNQILKLLKPNKVAKHYIMLAPFVIFFKDWRDDLRRKQVFEWVFLFDAIAKYLKVDRNDLGYYSFEELSKAITLGRLDKLALKTRKNKEFIVTVKKGKLSLQIIPGIPLKYKKAIAQANSLDTSIFAKGIVAQPGVVRGLVRVVKNHHDVKQVESGEILVSNTTHPDYLQAMKKAAAFVTDEGGIVSHAAIVAREFKKPCIVGTKIATQIFKDGDMVEVDANKGIVRKV